MCIALHCILVKTAEHLFCLGDFSERTVASHLQLIRHTVRCFAHLRRLICPDCLSFFARPCELLYMGSSRDYAEKGKNLSFCMFDIFFDGPMHPDSLHCSSSGR